MEFETTILENGLKHVILKGRMDMQGTLEIDDKFSSETSSRKAAVLVELTDVEFMASVGMRLLLKNARALEGRGGKMVLYNPSTLVKDALETAGVDKLIDTHDDYDTAATEALAAV